MRATDEMALAALDAQTAYWQDESLQKDCDNCKGTGTERIGYDGEQDWCHKCGGHGIDHQGTEEGAMRAALDAALSHAAGQDGEQCRAASGSDRDYTTDERAQIVNEFYLTMLDLRGAVTEEQERCLLRAGLLLRALSRGVPEGK